MLFRSYLVVIANTAAALIFITLGMVDWRWCVPMLIGAWIGGWAGARVGNRGWFFAPTVLADVPDDARIMSEEPFGPISPCRAVGSMDEALEIANSLPMGLAGFVFSNSVAVTDHLSRGLQVGSVAVNLFTSPGADAPFGGTRESGIGREGGPEMYHSYTVAKTIAERRQIV